MNFRLQNGLFLAAVVGSLVLVNVLGLRAFGRLDVTHDGAYTLSKATKDTLAQLDEPVTITAYFSDNLPAPYSSNARYVRDLLEEFRAASHGKVAFEFLDPAAQETAADKESKREVKQDVFGRRFREPTSVEKELTQAGIEPVEIRVIEDDQQQTRRAWMGLVVKHQEKKEVLPVVRSVEGLEYELTLLVRKLTRSRLPVVGLLQGHGEVPLDKLQLLTSELAQNWDVRPVQVTGEKFDPSLDALLVIGPKTALSAKDVAALDAFLNEGKSVAFFLDTVQVDLRTFAPEPAQHGLAPLLGAWGVTLGDRLVADVESATINVSERRGNFTVQLPVPFPFLPVVRRLEGDSPISKGLGEVLFPFATEVTVAAPQGVQATVLARSSKKSWLDASPPNLDPRRDWRNESPSLDGPHPLMVQLAGSLAGKGGTRTSKESRLVVVGSSGVVQDDFMANSRANQVLAMNVADWLMLDPALLAMRSRGVQLASLQPELGDGVRGAAKWGNALGLPFLLAMVGLVRWRSREARRATVAV